MAEVNSVMSLGSTITFTPDPPYNQAINVTRNRSCRLSYDSSSPEDADKCDKAAVVRLTFVASTPQTIDLQALSDISGGAVSFARVRKMEIVPIFTTDGATLKFDPGTSNGWTGLGSGWNFTIPAVKTTANDAFVAFAFPGATALPVSGTNKTLRITPSAHAIVLELRFVGSSA